MITGAMDLSTQMLIDSQKLDVSYFEAPEHKLAIEDYREWFKTVDPKGNEDWDQVPSADENPPAEDKWEEEYKKQPPKPQQQQRQGTPAQKHGETQKYSSVDAVQRG